MRILNPIVSGSLLVTGSIVLQTYDEGVLSLDAGGTVKTEPTFRNLSLGEGYADVAKEYHYSDGKTVYPSELGYNFAELLQADVLRETSLILTPTAIATGIVASQKPLSSDGDFSFSRSTSATRVNENGYIEKETQNLLTYSNDFSNAAWTNYLMTVTGGQTGYDGSLDAWLINKTASSRRTEQGSFNPGVYCFSVYVKSNTNNWVELYLDQNLPNDPHAFFDLQNGLVGTTSLNIDANIESVGNGWYRCSIVANTTTTFIAMIFPAEADNDKSATSGSILIQDAQLEQGLVARDYIETTTAAVYGGVTNNVPRIDYTDKTPSLLLEPQRTNLAFQSEYIGSSWNPYGNISVTANSVLSPEGIKNATRISAVTTTNDDIGIQDGFSVTANNKYTISFFAKKGTFRYIQLFHGSSQVALNARTNFDIQEGVVAYEESGVVVANIEDYGNGWYRCTATMEALLSILQAYIAVVPSADAIRSPKISATAGDDYYIYGIQLEQGSYPTAYIPTYGTAVTRSDEYMQVTPTDLLGSDIGAWYLELDDLSFEITGTQVPTIYLGDDNANCLALEAKTFNGIKNIHLVKEENNTSTTLYSFTLSGKVKICFVWDGTTLKLFKDGSLVYSETNFTQPTNWDEFVYNYGSREAMMRITNINLFSTALTDSECIELTKQ